ncbi:MAG: hypothetical protein LBT80_05300 [Lactobacillaceae bacterium]|jgi:hypothetical protein|nr:hypothetical protein [Lactobacillaceae bacterium]
MTIRYDMHQPLVDTELILLYKTDVEFDTGRKYTFDPKFNAFRMHFDNVLIPVKQVRGDANAVLYLQTHGHDALNRNPIADLAYEPISEAEINWL